MRRPALVDLAGHRDIQLTVVVGLNLVLGLVYQLLLFR